MENPTERHRRHLSVMRGWLEGRRYFKALHAFEMVRNLEEGFRKDGITPKFHHQLSVVRFLATLEGSLLYPEDTLTTAFLHDVLEDHDREFTKEGLTREFGQEVGDAVWILTKKYRGMTKPQEEYFMEIGGNPISSLVKPVDRAHNLQTMQGVFTIEKQRDYVSLVGNRFVGFVKRARRKFPEQYAAYANVMIFLRSQCEILQALHDAAAITDTEKVSKR